MQQKIKLTWWFVYEWGKPSRQKPHRVNLKSQLPRNHYYHNKRLQVNGILVLNTNLQLNPYPNTQLDLYVTNQSMHGFKYVTNHQLEKDVGCKILQFIHTMKITKLLDYKTLRRTNTATSSRERWTRAYVSSHNMLATTSATILWRPLK